MRGMIPSAQLATVRRGRRPRPLMGSTAASIIDPGESWEI